MTNKNKTKKVNRSNSSPETSRKTNGNNKKQSKAPINNKQDKPAYGIFVLAGVALILLVLTVVHFMKNEVPTSENPTKKAITTTTQAEGIDSNIYFGGISLGGLKYEEFENQISEKTTDLLESIELNFKKDEISELENSNQDDTDQDNSDNNLEDKSDLSFSALDLGASFDLEKIYQNAENLTDLIRNSESKKTNSFLQKVYASENTTPTTELEIGQLADLENNHYNLLPVFNLDNKVLSDYVDKLSDQLSIKAESSEAVSFNVETLEFEFGENKKGYELVTDDLIKDIERAFAKNDFVEPIKLSFKEYIDSSDDNNDHEDIGLIASAMTELMTYDPPRDANVARVAELLTGYIIQPGEEFSYWESISPITLENGYFIGNQIGEDGGMEPVIGGGICQGSSTLYVAAVKADLQISMRYNHTVPSLYAIEGIDAMVASWGADLKIVNDTDFPIAIVGKYYDATAVEFEIYGRKLPEGVTIGMDPQFVSEVAPKEAKRVANKSLSPGEEVIKKNAITGSKWTTDKVYYKDGVEIDRVHLNYSYYWAYEAVIEFGPEAPTTTPTTTTADPSKTTTSSTTTTTTTTTTEPPTT